MSTRVAISGGTVSARGWDTKQTEHRDTLGPGFLVGPTSRSRVHVLNAQSGIRLTPLRAIEQHPNREVGREIFESMRLTRNHEQKGAWLDRASLFAIEEDPRSPSHQVSFVAKMGPLQILTLGLVHFYVECPMGEDGNC